LFFRSSARLRGPASFWRPQTPRASCSGGADIRGALDLATLSQLGPGPAADLFAAQMMRNQASRTSAGQPSARSAPITAFYDVIVEGNILNAQKLAEYGL